MEPQIIALKRAQAPVTIVGTSWKVYLLMTGTIAGPFRFSIGETWLVAESMIELVLM